MSYSSYGRESNMGPWVSELRYASTAAAEFKPSSLGERWDALAYRRYGAPLTIGLGLGDGHAGRGSGLAGILDDVGGIVGPAIGAGIAAFEARATGALLQTPQAQAQALAVGKATAAAKFQEYAPWIVGGLVALLVLPKLLR